MRRIANATLLRFDRYDEPLTTQPCIYGVEVAESETVIQLFEGPPPETAGTPQPPISKVEFSLISGN